MTTYGTIPTAPPESSPTSDIEFISRAKQRIRSGLATRRPWKELVSVNATNPPNSLSESIIRIRTNVDYFQTNYTVIVLFVLFISLLWYPISLIVFFVMMAAWLFLYFLRDEPLRILNVVIGDRVVLVGLLVLTVVLLFLTGATLSIVIGLVVGVAVVLVHAAVVRNAGDLIADDEEIGAGGGGARLVLKETASSSFSSSP